MTRDTSHVTCRELAPLAGVTATSDDVAWEPHNIIPDYPSVRPADLALPLPFANNTDSTAVAVDVSVPQIQASPSGLRRNQPTTLLDAHWKREREKWDRTAHSSDNTPEHGPRLPVLQGLEALRIALIPFTIDHLGGIGPSAHSFLFHPRSAPFPPPPPHPPNNRLRPIHPLTRARAESTHLHLLTKATQQWSSPTISQRSIGSTYHSQSPSQWALQMLSVNFCHAFSSHLKHALHRARHVSPAPAIRPNVPTVGRQSFHSPVGGPTSLSRLPVVLI